MKECSHSNALRYARRIYADGSSQFCVQCSRCFKTVKTSRHGGKLFIKHSEIPPGALICDWIDPETVQGGLI